MIPIIAIANLVNGFISALLVVRLYARYRRRRRARLPVVGVGYFLVFYLSVAVLWLLYATPGLLVTDTYLIMVLQSLADVFVYVASIVLIQISFYAMNRQNIGVVLSFMSGTTAIVYVLGKIIYAAPHVREVIPPYVYWHPGTPVWLQVMTGIISGLSATIFISTFVSLGFRARSNAAVSQRSLYLAGGATFLFVATLAFFIFSTGGFLLTFVASIFGIIGLFLMLHGVPYRDQDSAAQQTSTPGVT